MMMSRLVLALSLTVAGFSLQSLTAAANTPADLVDQERLQVRSWLTPAEGIVPGQQVKLTLEIATDRWFTGGTRIRIPEVPGLVILQNDEFAANSSERRDRQSWVVQRWTLEVFPQRAGSFSIPPVSAGVTVNDDGSTTAEGDIQGPALQFSVTRPAALDRAQHWVAAPLYSVRQSFQRDLDNLNIGDAIEREIVFEAEDVMAMMLPAFEEEAIGGLAAYPEPPSLQNRSNRGTTLAGRTERITYIVEAEGEFQLPAQDFFWWDTKTAELQVLSLPTVSLKAGTAAPGEGPGESFNFRLLLIGAAGLVALGLLIWIAGKIPGNALLARLRGLYTTIWQHYLIFRKPALPRQLNPGNSGSK